MTNPTSTNARPLTRSQQNITVDLGHILTGLRISDEEQAAVDAYARDSSAANARQLLAAFDTQIQGLSHENTSPRWNPVDVTILREDLAGYLEDRSGPLEESEPKPESESDPTPAKKPPAK